MDLQPKLFEGTQMILSKDSIMQCLVKENGIEILEAIRNEWMNNKQSLDK